MELDGGFRTERVADFGVEQVVGRLLVGGLALMRLIRNLSRAYFL